MSDMPNDRLPALIKMQGGEVAKVLGWDQHMKVLTEQQQLQVGIMVQMYPRLNTEGAVDLLAEAAGYYGEELDRWFGDMVERYSIETVYLAIETMEQLGLPEHIEVSDGAGSSFGGERFELDQMLGVIEALTEAGHPVKSVERLEQCIEKLGNWETVRLLGPSHIAALMAEEVELEDIRRLVKAPSYNPQKED